MCLQLIVSKPVTEQFHKGTKSIRLVDCSELTKILLYGRARLISAQYAKTKKA